MTPLADRPLAEVLEEVADATPSPGGGSSAAWACALAASLVEMCAVISGSGRGESARELRGRALELAQADVGAYAPVLAAARLPVDDPARAGQLRAALASASAGPLEIAETGCEVAALAADLVRGGRPSIAGDAVTAVLLAEAATRAAVALVEANVGGDEGDERGAEARALAARAWQSRAAALGDPP
jgi:formiminotetrahydrofolate cyclodeaminase